MHSILSDLIIRMNTSSSSRCPTSCRMTGDSRLFHHRRARRIANSQDGRVHVAILAANSEGEIFATVPDLPGPTLRPPPAARPCGWSPLIPVEIPGKHAKVNLSIDEAVLKRVDQAAAQSGESRSGYFAAAALQRMRGDAGLRTTSTMSGGLISGWMVSQSGWTLMSSPGLNASINVSGTDSRPVRMTTDVFPASGTMVAHDNGERRSSKKRA